jgi:hypothetical protein
VWNYPRLPEDQMHRPDPLPLPGDLRAVQVVGPNQDESVSGRWQVQVYDATSGRWRAAVGRDVRGRPAFGRVEPTFATEAAALEHLLAFVRRPSG